MGSSTIRYNAWWDSVNGAKARCPCLAVFSFEITMNDQAPKILRCLWSLDGLSSWCITHQMQLMLIVSSCMGTSYNSFSNSEHHLYLIFHNPDLSACTSSVPSLHWWRLPWPLTPPRSTTLSFTLSVHVLRFGLDIHISNYRSFQANLWVLKCLKSVFYFSIWWVIIRPSSRAPWGV